MRNIQEIRQQYPQYSDLSDQQLADALHSKYYSDLPKNDFYQKVGINNPQQNQSQGQHSLLTILDPAQRAAAMQPVRGFLEGVTGSTIVPASQWMQKAGLIQQPLQDLRTGSGSDYEAGRFLGSAVPYAAMGGAGLAAKLLPALGKLAPFAASTGIGSAVGAFTNPDHPGMGAGLGGAFGAASQAIPAIIRSGKDLFNFLKPEKLKEQILSKLGKGLDPEQTSTSVADTLKKIASTKEAIAKSPYEEIVHNPEVKDLTILKEMPGYGTLRTGPKYASYDSEYLKKGKDIFDQFPTSIREIHDRFVNDPSIYNAHFLQSALGKKAYSMSLPDTASQELRKVLLDSRKSLQKDLFKGLREIDPQLEQKYINAGKIYNEEYGHYLENKKLKNILSGENTSPNLDSLFKNPGSKMQKVRNDLPDDVKNQIIYSKLSTANNSKDLIKVYKELANSGLSTYKTPELDELMKSLQQRQFAKRSAQVVGGIAGLGALEGALRKLGIHLPIPGVP